MKDKEDKFLDQLRATFKVEAAEHVQAMTAGLLALEKSPGDEARRELVATVFRAAHSLKGAARAADFNDIESSCQALEDLFASWNRAQNKPSPVEADAARRALDAIDAIGAALEGANRSTPVAPPPVQPVVPRAGRAAPPQNGVSPRDGMVPRSAANVQRPIMPALGAAAPEASMSAVATPEAPAPAAAMPSSESAAASAKKTVRIAVEKLDAHLADAEELLTAKLVTRQRTAELRALSEHFEGWRKEWATLEPDVLRLHRAIDAPTAAGLAADPGLARVLDFFEWNRDQLKLLESNLSATQRAAQQDCHVVGKLVDDLLDDSKRLLLTSFSSLSAPFGKLVRDLCRDLGKEAELVVQGEDVEIDKRILEEIKDSLIHLLRNCVDHGIETPEVRARAGKPARATITLAVSQTSGNNVEIVVADDGAGIDVQKVKAAAAKLGILPASGRSLDDREACDLVFRSEVSTSPIITRLSGRGLGMAIVREQAEKLGGAVSVESQPGAGTRCRIVLPTLRATFRGVLVAAAGQQFVVPTKQVERVVRVKTADLRTVEGRETVAFNGRALSLVRLADVLKLPAAGANDEPARAIPLLVLGQGEHRIAFAVDAVLDEQEVLVKPLRMPLSRVRNVAAATVLGSGRVVPILHVPDLLKSARSAGAAPKRTPAAERVAPPAAKSVLAVDDSATSRMLIKGMLESAGYKVVTAVDGLEAFTLLRAEKFDVLVSDVEMPRLNGFDLVARVRADRKLNELPVVLVTARETREDRERGIDVGANAYIVKSNLDESNLLDAVRRLA